LRCLHDPCAPVLRTRWWRRDRWLRRPTHDQRTAVDVTRRPTVADDLVALPPARSSPTHRRQPHQNQFPGHWFESRPTDAMTSKGRAGSGISAHSPTGCCSACPSRWWAVAGDGTRSATRPRRRAVGPDRWRSLGHERHHEPSVSCAVTPR
jgi:hypothetical protein